MSQKWRLINIIPLILAFVVYHIRLPCSEREATSPQDGELRLLRAEAWNTSDDCSHALVTAHPSNPSCRSVSLVPDEKPF